MLSYMLIGVALIILVYKILNKLFDVIDDIKTKHDKKKKDKEWKKQCEEFRQKYGPRN